MGVDTLEAAWHGSATVGERGQVVIPASARELLGIKPGDKLMVFVPPTAHAVVFLKLQHIQAMTETLARLEQSVTQEEDNEEGVPTDDGGTG